MRPGAGEVHPTPAIRHIGRHLGWDTERERRQLRRFILIDLGVTIGATLFLVTVHLTVSTSIFVLVAAGATALAAVAMAAALVPLRQGRTGVALNLMAGANWGIAIVATVVAPFGMPILMIVALVPAALAVPFVDRVRLRRYAIGTIAVASTVVAAGTLQDASGIEDGLPGWIPTLTILLFTPVMAGLVVVTTYQAIEALTLAYTDAVRSRDQLVAAQARIVLATDDARRQIERDLHDGAQQRLTALAIGLGRIHARAEREGRPEAADLADLRGHLADARTELRRLAHGLYPSTLAADGLEMALRSEADRFDIPVRVQCQLGRTVPVAIQTAIYFCCLEAIQNAVTHGKAGRIDIEVRTKGHQVSFAVTDDGIGFDPDAGASGQGLTNMGDRLGAFGGQLRIDAAPGRPTRIEGRLPLPFKVVTPVDQAGLEAVRLSAGDTLFEQGDPSDLVYLIEEGEIDVVRQLADGGEEHLVRLGPGHHVGELGPLMSLPRSATVRARTDARLTPFTASDFRDRFLRR